jgi:ATP-dependent Clp protease ATP-binding subunit ClpA
MVELALPRQLHAIGQRAIAEARLRRASAVDAEHVLLAILSDRSGPASARLGPAGLDYDRLRYALDDERRRSLAVAGIAPISAQALVATQRTATPGWGASIREVLRNADRPATRSGRPGALEIELATAILGADLGTVPRALALAKIDPSTLMLALSYVRSN